MHIKVGDIVRYSGIEQRLMMGGLRIFRLSHYGVIEGSLDDSNLIESVTLPHLEVGNWVIVNNIPIQEKNMYLTPWYDGCEEIVTSGKPYQIKEICDTFTHGKVIKIGSHWFLPYHLAPTMEYDMI